MGSRRKRRKFFAAHVDGSIEQLRTATLQRDRRFNFMRWILAYYSLSFSHYLVRKKSIESKQAFDQRIEVELAADLDEFGPRGRFYRKVLSELSSS